MNARLFVRFAGVILIALAILGGLGYSLFPITPGTVHAGAKAIVVDDGSEGFRSSGGWMRVSSGWTRSCTGVDGDARWTYSRYPGYSNDVDWAKWTPDLPQSGMYEVFIFGPGVNNGRQDTQRARYRVHHANGDKIVNVTQRGNWCRWVSLGTFQFQAGKKGYVYLGDYTGGENPQTSIVADAIKFVYRSGDSGGGGKCSGDGVYLYEHTNYRGRCRKWTESDKNLTNEGFNDIASSIKFVGKYAKGKYIAILYEHAGRGGARSAYGANDTNLGNDEIGHDRVSSIHIEKVPQCKGDGIYLYEHANYGGRCRKFTQDIKNMKDTGFNDIASSIKLAGAYAGGSRKVTVCQHANFKGKCTTFTAKDGNLGNNAIGHDQISSLRVRYTFDWPVGKPRGKGWGVYGYTFLQDADNGLGYQQYHQGVDISQGRGVYGQPVFAAYGGKVTDVFVGACIIVEHKVNGKKVWTQYKHVDALVQPGQKLKKGQKVATINTHHLHFEVAREKPACGYVVGKSCQWVESHYENPLDWIGPSGGKTRAASCP